ARCSPPDSTPPPACRMHHPVPDLPRPKGPPMPAVIDTLIGYFAAYGYPVLFFGIMLEHAGIPLPGETALLVAGYLASPEAGGHFHLWAVIGVAFAAAVVGDNLGYLLGRRVVRRRLAAGRGFLFLTPERIRR